MYMLHKCKVGFSLIDPSSSHEYKYFNAKTYEIKIDVFILYY